MAHLPAYSYVSRAGLKVETSLCSLIEEERPSGHLDIHRRCASGRRSTALVKRFRSA
jgi:hypothetical protein